MDLTRIFHLIQIRRRLIKQVSHIYREQAGLYRRMVLMSLHQSMMRRKFNGVVIGECRRSSSLMISKTSAIGLGRQRMVLMDMSFVAEVIIRQLAFSSPVLATAMGLRSALPVRTATIGRLFRTRATIRTRKTTTRGVSASVLVAAARTTTAATTGSLFALFKGSPNSEHKRAHSILQFLSEHQK